MNPDYILRKNGLYFFATFGLCHTMIELDFKNEKEKFLITSGLNEKNAEWFAIRVKLEKAYEKRKNELLNL